MSELLPCPFCGGKAENGSYRSCDCCGKPYNGQVCCTACEASVSHLDSDAEAIAAWNARAAIAAMPGEPVAWQWKWKGEQTWSRNDLPTELVNHHLIEKRPLYAAPAMPATDAMQEAIQYLRDIESHMMTNDIDMQMGDHLPPTIIADRLESALSHPAPSGWQPIETAPKDGTPILGWSDEGVSYVCWYDRGQWTFFKDHRGNTWHFEPTKWIPHPALPEANP